MAGGVQPAQLELALEEYEARLNRDGQIIKRFKALANNGIEAHEGPQVLALIVAYEENYYAHRGVAIWFRRVFVGFLRAMGSLRYGDKPDDGRRVEEEIALVARREAELAAETLPRNVKSIEYHRAKKAAPVPPSAA